MDILSFNKKLNKISALADNGNSDGHFSSLERDLLLSYIRELYEIVLDGKESRPKPEISAPSSHKYTGHQIAVVTEHDNPNHKEKPEVVQVAEVKTHVPAEAPVPVIEKIVPTEVVPEEKPVIVKREEKNSHPDILAEMFASEKISDLSDKLSQSAIKDLTKSMGINERIFTQQELFGNNQQQFNDTLQKLNNCHNFEEAKQYLIENVIYTFDWVNESKVKKATTFIKLVKRKFV